MNNENQRGNEIYYVGVIDILQQYNTGKRLENFFKVRDFAFILIYFHLVINRDFNMIVNKLVLLTHNHMQNVLLDLWMKTYLKL